MNLKIYYSHTPFWRAEVLRLTLFIGNIPFEDIRITKEEFRDVILTGKLRNKIEIPFHQFPRSCFQNFLEIAFFPQVVAGLYNILLPFGSNVFYSMLLSQHQLARVLEQISYIVEPLTIDNFPKLTCQMRAKKLEDYKKLQRNQNSQRMNERSYQQY